MQIKLTKKSDIGYFMLETDNKVIGEVHYFFSFPNREPRIKVSLNYDVSLSDFNDINQYLQNYDFKKSILEDFNTKQNSMQYQVKVFPFKDNEFSSIEEAKEFVEGYYQDRNDIEGRRWLSSHDGWEYPKPEANDTITNNKPTELGIIRVRPTMNDSDYLSKKVSELKSKTTDIPIYSISFDVIPRYFALGYVSQEEVTKFNKEDLKRVLEQNYSKDEVIELLLRMLSNEGTVIKGIKI